MDEADKQLRIAADILDAIDPDLSDDERAKAIVRAKDLDAGTALAITFGILAGFMEQIHKMYPGVLEQLRKNAGNIQWPGNGSM